MAFSFLTVKISDDLYATLKQRALDEKTTIWRQVEEALKEYLNK
ncbi:MULTISPECIES: hypothetical protein [unclassified Microcoleus]